ncbi:MAG: PepSY domain-containing protein [Gemmatimonadota bacterium]
MLRIPTLVAVCALVCTLSEGARAQQTTTSSGTSNVDPKLAAEAQITLDSARSLALHRVPHGTVASEELERENGRLIYSFDVKVPGKSGIQEVNVNALTGKVLGVHHEGPATEKKEAAADSAAARKTSSRRASP